ncbi:MAG: hypothetical protein GX106_01720 [Candidatus Cloacimonetes bacterium]|jgi:hypothetical protein|nr:hypothetical protein [Candidatus Cloacimonadota bacterium]
MKKYLYILLFAVIALSLTSCGVIDRVIGGEKMIVKYEIELTKVNPIEEAQADAKTRVPVLNDTLEKIRYSYEDELMQSMWFVDESGWEVTFTNKGDRPIMIDWDEVMYMDIDKMAHRVLSKKTKLSEKEEPQDASVIARRGTLSEELFPADMYYQSSTGLINKRPMFPVEYGEAQRYKGKTFTLNIPLTVEGYTAQYEFVFTIKEVKQEVSATDPWRMYHTDRAIGINY